MDIFAHSISGALLGRAVRPEGDGWKKMALYGAIAGISPDVDAPIAFIGAEAWFRWHQFFTHSLVGLIWIPAALSLTPWNFSPWRTQYALAIAGWALHVLLDICALWPVPFAWPFFEARWNLSLISSDFSWTIDMLMLVGLTATLWDPMQKYARWIAAVTTIVIVLWFIIGLPT